MPDEGSFAQPTKVFVPRVAPGRRGVVEVGLREVVVVEAGLSEELVVEEGLIEEVLVEEDLREEVLVEKSVFEVDGPVVSLIGVVVAEAGSFAVVLKVGELLVMVDFDPVPIAEVTKVEAVV